MSPSAALDQAWKDQATWSSTAGHLKTQIASSRKQVLWLLSSTAILTTAAAGFTPKDANPQGIVRALAFLGALSSMGAAWLQVRAKSEDRTAKWTRARSASEALKEQVYRYAARSGDYATEGRDDVLRKAVARIVGQVNDLAGLSQQVSPQKPPPDELDGAGYMHQRVQEQIEGYYRRQARALARKGNDFRRFQKLLLGAASAAGVAAGFYPGLGLAPWIAVLTTIAGAVAADIEASRYDLLVTSYYATAHRLEQIYGEWRDRGRDREWTAGERDEFINRAEEAISVENQAWMAEWAKPTPPA